jgi:hypothetical protein
MDWGKYQPDDTSTSQLGTWSTNTSLVSVLHHFKYPGYTCFILAKNLSCTWTRLVWVFKKKYPILKIGMKIGKASNTWKLSNNSNPPRLIKPSSQSTAGVRLRCALYQPASANYNKNVGPKPFCWAKLACFDFLFIQFTFAGPHAESLVLVQDFCSGGLHSYGVEEVQHPNIYPLPALCRDEHIENK